MALNLAFFLLFPLSLKSHGCCVSSMMVVFSVRACVCVCVCLWIQYDIVVPGQRGREIERKKKQENTITAFALPNTSGSCCFASSHFPFFIRSFFFEKPTFYFCLPMRQRADSCLENGPLVLCCLLVSSCTKHRL